MMDEHNALDELKKVDHLVFVTLKYTRTVDIIKSALEHMITTLDTQFTNTLDALHSTGKVRDVPPAPVMRVKLLESAFPKDKELKNINDFYFSLKKIVHSEYKKKEEYRKNVALVTPEVEVNIDTLKEYVIIMKKYINYLQDLSEL